MLRPFKTKCSKFCKFEGLLHFECGCCFSDVAIGSPYDGPDRRGAVFIYHGTQEGIESNYRQVHG